MTFFNIIKWPFRTFYNYCRRVKFLAVGGGCNFLVDFVDPIHGVDHYQAMQIAKDVGENYKYWNTFDVNRETPIARNRRVKVWYASLDTFIGDLNYAIVKVKAKQSYGCTSQININNANLNHWLMGLDDHKRFFTRGRFDQAFCLAHCAQLIHDLAELSDMSENAEYYRRMNSPLYETFLALGRETVKAMLLFDQPQPLNSFERIWIMDNPVEKTY